MENNSKQLTALRMSNLESKQLTRECIQTAFFYLLSDQPFEKITVSDIIRRSGVSRAGFYRNYSSKEAVLEDITTTTFDKLRTFFTDSKYINNDYQKCLDYFIEIKKNAETARLLIHAKVPHEYILLKTEAFLNDVIPCETTKDYYRLIALITSLREVTIAWFENGMKESPEEMTDFFMGLFH